MKKLYYLFLIFVSFSLNAMDSYESKTVKDIRVILEKTDPDLSFDPQTVLSKMKTEKGDPFQQLVFDQDLKNLAEEFDRIEPKIYEKNGSLTIDLHVWPKPTIRSIRFTGNSKVRTGTLKKELGIKTNTVFKREEFNKALNKIKELYLKKGFFESAVKYEIHPIENKNTIDIDILIQEGKSGKIKSIYFEGFTKEEKKILQSSLYTKTYNPLTSWMTGHGNYREELLEQDQLIMINLLQNKGYADAKVSTSIQEEGKGIKIILQAHRGTLYRTGNINFKGNTLISNEAVKKRITIQKKDPYSPDKIREVGQSIKDLYGQKGYIESHVYFDTQPRENEAVYDVTYQIEEGEKFKIGLIRVFGNRQTQTNVILRESLLIPGDTFDARKLKATQRRLENIGYFKNVNVYAVRSTDDLGLGPNYRDVYIEIEETTTGNASLFLGVSSLEDVFGGLELTERNFSRRGFTHAFTEGPSSFRGGGEYFHVKGTVGSKQYNALVSWVDPYFRDTLWRFGVEGSFTRSSLQSKDYRTMTYGGSVFASYPLSNFWTFGTKYRLRNSITDIRKSAPEDLKKEGKSDGIISAISTNLGYDSTDNAYKPHRGIRSYGEVEFVGLGGKFTYFKFGYLNSYYIPVWVKGTLKFRADFNFIQNFGNTKKEEIPLSERYYLGGENTVRGYKPYILGPRFDKIKDPKGGLSSSLFSTEYNQSIFPILDLFVFFDAGSVSEDHFKIDKVNASYGVGIRFEIMNRMPLTIGYGFPINPDHEEDVRNLFFSFGGQF